MLFLPVPMPLFSTSRFWSNSWGGASKTGESAALDKSKYPISDDFESSPFYRSSKYTFSPQHLVFLL
jgi:hypothetical protein